MYKIIEVVTVGQLTVDMGEAEREGYEYVGAVANPGDSVVIMHREGVGTLTGLRVPRIVDALCDAVVTDGAHHKQWYLEQIAEIMEVALPEHDEGIIP